MINRFKRADWIRHTSIYEVNVRQYTPEGTLSAFMQHLPRLKAMGVETLWFMPLTPIAEKNKKGSLGSYYACSDYTSVSPEFGTLDDFKQLVQRAHEMGFKIIIDWVANHTGWDHIWTKEHPEYYKIDPATGDFQRASGMDDIIELDFSNPALRRAMIDAMRFWITECGIDGFRCDLAFWVELGFWKEARKELDAIRPLFWLGEFDELEKPEYGEAFDASYSWTWMHRTEEFYKKGLPLADLYEVLEKYDNLGDHTQRAWFTSNHDENSWNGTEYEKYGAMAPALAVFSATWNGIPLLYTGQEIPNKRRIQFFDKNPVEWTGTGETEQFYKTLLELKKNHPALAGGDPDVQTFRIKTSEPDRVFAYLRKKGTREVLVLLHFSGDEPAMTTITDDHIGGKYRNVFTNEMADLSEEGTLLLKGWEYRVFER